MKRRSPLPGGKGRGEGGDTDTIRGICLKSIYTMGYELHHFHFRQREKKGRGREQSTHRNEDIVIVL